MHLDVVVSKSPILERKRAKNDTAYCYTISTITTVISDRYPIYLILNKWINENHHFLIISYTDSTIG